MREQAGIATHDGQPQAQALGAGFGGVEPHEQVAREQRFDALANEVLLDALGLREARHPRSGVRHHGDQTVSDQDAQRLAHRNATCPKLLGQLLLANALTRRHGTRENLLAQGVGNASADDRGGGFHENEFL